MNSVKKLVKWIYHVIKNRGKQIKFVFLSDISIASKFEGCNAIGKSSCFHGEMGYGSYMGHSCNINAKIGRYCSISDRVVVVRGTHPSKKFVSTHPCFFSTRKQAGFTYVDSQLFEENTYVNKEKNSCLIGNDVWIGYGVTILEGLTIGDGSIIATGAVVTKDVAPYSIVGGVPAKEIRKRFEFNQIQLLRNIEWWNQEEKWLKENVNKFKDIDNFVSFSTEEFENENM